MNKKEQIYNIQRLIEFRHEMHENPESSFQEWQTQKRITQYLISIGVNEAQIKICAKTGLIVDIQGMAPSQGSNRIIAFRADIDALIMDEDNIDLPYRSVNGCAHMCGHDGHTTSLLGFASLWMDIINEIPSNKIIRLLFQPAEEKIGGAIEMIKEGCLNGVQEVYGCHQWPTGKIGEVWVKPGPMMSDPTIFKIKIQGKGGHASEPHKFKNPILPGVEFLQNINQIFTKIQKEEKKNFTFCFPVFQAGKTMNVIPDEAEIIGMVRSLEEGFGERSISIVEHTLQQATLEYGFQFTLQIDGQGYRLTSNTEAEADHIQRLGEQFFGPGKANYGPCPVYASEDFGWYNHTIPGAFFFLSSGRNEQDNPLLHQSNFNYNDDLIDISARFWLLIAKDRLELN